MIIEEGGLADVHKLCGDTSDTLGDFSDVPINDINKLSDLSRGLG